MTSSPPTPSRLPTAADPDASKLGNRLLIGVLILGVVSRLHRYFAGRSLWLDEATLVGQILDRDILGLFTPLGGDQAAPPLFLLLVKMSSQIFGASEWALRLVPLLAGLASLVIFLRVARRLFVGQTALLLAALFAVLEPLIDYSVEVKQYSLDVLVGLWLLDRALVLLEGVLTPRRALAFGLQGALAVWLSQPSVLVLAGLGTVLGWTYLFRGSQRSILLLAASVGGWLLSFAGQYVLLLRHSLDNDYLKTFWAQDFPSAGSSLTWYPGRLLAFCNDPLGFPASSGAAYVAALMLVAGALLGIRRHPLRGALLLAPLLFTLLACALGLYPFPTSWETDITTGPHPFVGRLLLFLVPWALLGMGPVLDLVRRRSGGILVWGTRALLLLLVGQALIVFVRFSIQPPRVQEMGPIVAQMHERFQLDDQVFVLTLSEPVFAYYAAREGLEVQPVPASLRTTALAEATRRRFAALPSGQRFWLISLHHPKWDTHQELEQLLRNLAPFTTPLERLRELNAEAMLLRTR